MERFILAQQQRGIGVSCPQGMPEFDEDDHKTAVANFSEMGDSSVHGEQKWVTQAAGAPGGRGVPHQEHKVTSSAR